MTALKSLFSNHPRLAFWLVLSLGMVAILVYTARDVGLLASQWFWLIVITVAVAGLCIRIIGWDDEDDMQNADLG